MTSEAAPDVASAQPRKRIRTVGKIVSVRVIRTRDLKPGSAVRLRVECELDDGTGSLWLLFLGRRELPGVVEGRRMCVEGVVVPAGDRLTLLNPVYSFEQD